MTIANASAFLDELKTNGPTPELLGKIGTDFTKEHVSEALKARGNSKDQLLAHAAGGSAPTEWCNQSAPVSNAAAAGA
jgi:hypothetical protein